MNKKNLITLDKRDLWKFLYKEQCRYWNKGYLNEDEFKKLSLRYRYFLKNKVKDITEDKDRK